MKERKRLVAIFTVLMILFNLLSPYTILLNTVEAATGEIEKDPLVFNNLGVTTKGSSKMLTLEIAIVSEEIINGLDLKFKIDTDKIVPCNRNTGAPSNVITLNSKVSDYCQSAFQIKEYDSTEHTYSILTTEPKGGTDIVNDMGYVPGSLGDPAIDENGSGFPAYYPLITLYFKIQDSSLDTDNLNLDDLFTLSPVPYSLPTGIKIAFKSATGGNISRDISAIHPKGFATSTKTVSSITVKTNPTKTTYNHGDAIDVTGGVLTVTYSDGSEEDVSMTDPKVSVISGSPANVNNQSVGISYGGKTVSFPITVEDPVDSLIVKTPMNKLEYTHGDALNFTGLQLEATRKSGAKINLTQSSQGVGTSETIASVNSSEFTQTSTGPDGSKKGQQKIKFTYEGKEVTQTVIVNDTIASIKLKSQPTKTVYKVGEALDLSGAVVEVTLESGTKTNINLPDGSVTVSSYNVNTTGSKQHLSVSMGTKVATDTIDVEAYNYVKSIQVTAPTKVSYNYNEALDLTGGNVKAQWKVGTSIATVDLTDSTITVTGYNKTQIGNQTLTVTYKPVYTLSDGTQITDTLTGKFDIEVEDSATAIAITAPSKTTYNHGEALDLTGGTIKVTTASGAVKNVTMTTAMITENGAAVNMSPTAADFGNNTTLNKTLTITYSEGGKTETINYPITIVNNVKSIAMHTTPKTQYNVNESLDLTTDGTKYGEISVTRAVGTDEIVSLNDSRVTVSGFDSTQEHTNLQLTVKFEENGISENTNYNVSVVDSVTAITMKDTPKQNYKYNETLDVTGGKITVTKGSGTQDISITASMVTEMDGTPFDSTNLGTRDLKVTYGGQTTKYQITVKDYVTGIALDPDTVTGAYNDALTDIINDNSIKYKVTYAKAGTQPAQPLTDSMVSGYSPTSTSAQNLTVTYTDNDSNSATKGDPFVATLKVTLSDGVGSIAITAPTKTTYNHGDALDLAGGTITVTSASGAVKNVTMTTAMITENGSAVNMSPTASDFGSNTTLNKTLTITYTEGGKTETINYPITIINDVRSIAMHTTPKTQYNVNESLDLTTDGTTYGEISVKRAVGTDEIVSLNDSRVTVSGFDSAVEHTNLQLTVKFEENGISENTNYNVSVVDSVTAITMKDTPKQNYKYNESLDVTGGKITVTKGSGTQDITITSSMVTEMDGSPFDPTNLGTRDLKVTYGGQTTKYEITVKDYVTGIALDPDTVTGAYNDTLTDIINDNSIKYKVTYAKAGTQAAQPLTDSMVSGYNPASTNQQNLTVTYTDNDANSATNGDPFVATLKVTLSDGIGSIAITAPTKTTYNHGDALDLAGATITVTSASGAVKNVTMTTAMITEGGSAVNMSPTAADFGNNTTLNKTLTITYSEGGKTETINYPITIINDVRSIAMHTTPKTQYNVNDSLDLTTDGTNYGDISVKRAVGTDEIVSLNDSRVTVSGFDSTVEHTNLQLTVKFEENGISENTNYNVSVVDSVTSVAMKDIPKQNYKYNEPLDVTGGKITITKGSGTQDIPMNASMVTEMDGSPFDPTKLGTRDLKVTYGGQTTKYQITIKDYVTGITLNPDTVTGKYNAPLTDIINDNSITYTVTYAKAGAQSAQPLTDSMVSGYNSASINQQNLTVTYTDKDSNSATNGDPFVATLKVTLSDGVGSIAITAPTKTTYNHGEALDLAGATITVTTSSGAVKTVPMTTAMITENGSAVNMSPTAADFGSNTTLNKTLTITYTEGGKTETINYPITIVNDVRSIAMNTTPKTQYNVNDSLDLTTDGTNYGDISVKRAVGADEIVSLNDSRVTVSGFDSTVEHTNLQLTVKFEENGISENTNYNVSVVDSVTSITMKDTPKQNYKYNEILDVTGGKITITRGSGTQDIPINPSMVTEMDGTPFDPTNLGTRDLKVTYGGQTTKYQVTVKDYVTGITLNPASVTGKYNAALTDIINDNSITYTVTYAKAGAQSAQPLTDSMVSGYNSTSISTQNLTVTYTDNDTNSATNGDPFVATLNVKLIDEIAGIVIKKNPDKTEYGYGETIDKTGGIITVTTKSGKTEDITFNETGVTLTETDGSPLDLTNVTFDANHKATKTIQVNYQGQKANFTVDVINKITGIVMENIPKTKYNVGDSLDLTTDGTTVGTIKVTRQNNETESIPLDNVNVKVTGFDSTAEHISLGLDVSYTENSVTKKTSYIVSVTDTISSIAIENTPKTQYKYGEKLDVSTGTLKVVKGTNTEIINITPSMVSGFNPNQLGDQTLTVTYKGQTTNYKVNVEDWTKDINIVKPDKLVYKIGESMDLTGGKVNLVMASGATKAPVDMKDVTVTGFDSTTEGAKLIQVSYAGFTKTYGITVVDALSGMIIKTLPDKLDYRYGEKLDVTGGTIEIQKESGAKEVINMTDAMISGYNPNQLGPQTLTVTYQGYTQQFIVNVEDYVSELKVQEPSKVEYEYGENLDVTGGKVSIIMASGKVQENVDMTASMVSGYDSKKEGDQNIKVEYKGLQGNFQVKVVDKIKGISLNTAPDKKNYKHGEDIDVTGATIKVIKSSGVEIVPVTKDMISGYDANKSGTQTITITYGGYTTSFDVFVKEQEKDNKPSNNKPSNNKPSTNNKPTTIVKNTTIVYSNEQANTETPEEVVEQPKDEPVESVRTQEPRKEKPTETLGVKEEKDDNSQGDKILAGGLGISAALLLLLLFIFRRNVKIYVEEDGEFVLAGTDKINKKDRDLDIDKYLDKETYDGRVKIVLNDSISKKLDGKELKLIHREQIVKCKIDYDDEPVEIILE